MRDRNEEIEILTYAIYTRLFFTVISFIISLFLIPYIWEKVKNSQDQDAKVKLQKEMQKNDPNFIDWSIVFPEDFQPHFTLHKGVFLMVIIGAVLSFLLILVGVKMNKFLNELKEAVNKLNISEVQLVADDSEFDD